MDINLIDRPNSQSRIFLYIYFTLVFMLALSGFAQMPIFKRYYIADIPGLGWLAKFYITHYIHYLAAILFVALFVYVIIDFLGIGRKRFRITTLGYIKGTILTGLLVTGLMLVQRNLTGHKFSPNAIIALDIAHLSLAVLFLFFSLLGVVFKKRWAQAKNSSNSS